ncbi:MAG: hypothetical protein AAF702_31750 [Chloroflexota bacterium]
MSEMNPQLKAMAIQRFQRIRNRAEVNDLLSMITGGNRDLVKFDEVAQRIKARQQREIGIQNIPLKQIVGSVGRYRDFTRTFLPRSSINQERWTTIDTFLNGSVGSPPVDLYKMGEVYFVRDGNHRVSVARANGLDTIEAYVTEVAIDIPLTLNDFDRDQWIMKTEQKEFLQKTFLDTLRPEQDVRFTEPGRYKILLRHMEVHYYFLGEEAKQAGSLKEIEWQDAIVSWYDTVYMPVVDKIRESGLLTHFPKRTEADLFLWISHHRERLSHHYKLAPLSPDVAVSTFAETHSERPLENAVQGLRQGIQRVLGREKVPPGMTPEEFEELRARHDAGEVSLSEAEEQNQSLEPVQAP